MHPYAKLAWQIVSSVYKVNCQRNLLEFHSFFLQVVQKQIATDQKLVGLVATMESTYSFVDVIQSDGSEKVKVLEETIKRIFAQTVECAIFIREYVDHGFAGTHFDTY